MSKQKNLSHEKAKIMMVLFVPDNAGIDFAHVEMLKSGFSMDRSIIPAYAVGENDLPGRGMYLMQEIKSGANS